MVYVFDTVNGKNIHAIPFYAVRGGFTRVKSTCLRKFVTKSASKIVIGIPATDTLVPGCLVNLASQAIFARVSISV
jgi:hypothetical protein